MNTSAEFFSAFPPVGKDEWLAQIAKDLKGKPLQDLYWHLNGDLTVDPFTHADDFKTRPLPLFAQPRDWEINEDIECAAVADANKQALEALNGGVESLYFSLPSPTGLDGLLAGVYPDLISLHFGGTGLAEAPALVLAELVRAAQDRKIPVESMRGSLYYDPAAEAGNLHDWRYVVEMVQYATAALPGFRCITVDGRPAFAGKAAVPDELAALVKHGMTYLDKLTARGLSPDEVAAQLQFSLYAGNSYFVEIARLRAFHLLWMNVLQGWGVAPAYPILDVRFDPTVYTNDLYTNMIRATTMAMSAVLGGANRLTVRPYDSGREAGAVYPQSFARRIARNVQHLLKLESAFSAHPDPAAGSYYIEKLTEQFVNAAWAKF